MKRNQLAIHLRIFKGPKMAYDEKGNSINENHLVHLAYDTAEYKKYLSLLPANGIIKAEVEKVLDLNKVNEGKEKSDADYYKSVDDFEDIQAEIDAIMNPEGVVELTPDQKRIQELEAKVNALLGKTEDSEDDNSELKEARAKYEELYGKKGGPKWTVEEINQKIAEFKPAE